LCLSYSAFFLSVSLFFFCLSLSYILCNSPTVSSLRSSSSVSAATMINPAEQFWHGAKEDTEKSRITSQTAWRKNKVIIAFPALLLNGNSGSVI
jgi:hypothetical protein